MRFADAPPALWLRRLLAPLLAALSLYPLTAAYGVPFSAPYLLLGIMAFFVTAQVFGDLGLPEGGERAALGGEIGRVLPRWVLVVGILLFLGYATQMSEIYSRRVLFTWFAATPTLLVLAQSGIRWWLTRVHAAGGGRSVVIAGANSLGARLSHLLAEDRTLLMDFHGFFDDRGVERLACTSERLLGRLGELADYVRKHRIQVVYITLPLSAQKRVTDLFSALRDTTASVYYVPDIFVFDLIQARLGHINGIPVVAVLETPFTSLHAFNKRAFDVLVASGALLLTAPLMLLIALAIKLESRGPVLYKQYRYGLDGNRIRVYKFRTMRVCETDDAQILQARRNDERFTRFGRFLRRSSLDELPQLFNVLRGSMSVVGPRPHAVAHNEQYRKLIPGYMVRHKVKPGITGLAQVNGFRGETETLEKMEMRVRYDLDYLRYWSLWLDFKILLRTVVVVLKRQNAY